MKINIKNISLSAMAIIALASCSDVVDYSVPDRTSNSGAPAISQIYDVQDTGFVAPLNGGVLNQMIHIKGQNLANAKKIRFNDVDVDVRQVMQQPMRRGSRFHVPFLVCRTTALSMRQIREKQNCIFRFQFLLWRLRD